MTEVEKKQTILRGLRRLLRSKCILRRWHTHTHSKQNDKQTIPQRAYTQTNTQLMGNEIFCSGPIDSPFPSSFLCLAFSCVLSHSLPPLPPPFSLSRCVSPPPPLFFPLSLPLPSPTRSLSPSLQLVCLTLLLSLYLILSLSLSC